VKEYIKNCARIIKGAILGKSTMRFIIAIFYYYKARILYDYSIVNNEKFRAAVVKNNWIEED